MRPGPGGLAQGAGVALQVGAQHLPGLVLQPVGAEHRGRLPVVFAEAAGHLRGGAGGLQGASSPAPLPAGRSGGGPRRRRRPPGTLRFVCAQ